MAVDRGHAQQGQIVRIGIKFTLAGSPIDPSEIRQVEITDQDGNVLSTLTGALIVHDGTGLYHVDWPIPITEPANVHYDKWYATAISGGAEEVFTNIFQVLTFNASTVNTPYMTTPEARLYLPPDTTATDLQIAENVVLGQQWIERITGRWFLPRSETRTFHGNGFAVLGLDHGLLSVAEVRILNCGGGDDSLIAPTAVRIGHAGTTLALGNAQRFGDRLLGVAGPPWIRSGGCGVWPTGFMNVQITGDWGDYAEVPIPIKRALGALLRYTMICDDPYATPTAAFGSESIPGDRQYTMRDIWTANITKNATGYGDIDAILSSYKEDFSVTVV
jgi:hypothetical protein